MIFEGEKLIAGKAVTVQTNLAREAWADVAAGAAGLMPDSAKAASYQMAVRIYAPEASAKGVTEFDEDLFHGEFQKGLGAQIRGGLPLGGGRQRDGEGKKG